MNLTRSLLSLLMAVALPGALGASTTLGATSDSLYIGDASDNTIKHFDAQTGASLGVFVPTSAGLVGPRGILHVDRRLLVSNQNVNLKIPGEIDQFSIMDGTSLRFGPSRIGSNERSGDAYHVCAQISLRL